VLTVTAVFIYRGLGDAKKTRHGALITDIARRWDDPATVDAFKVISRYAEDDLLNLVEAVWGRGTAHATSVQVNDFFTLSTLPNLFDMIGALHRDGAIDIAIIDALWGATIRDQWELWRPPIFRMRDISNANTHYTEFQTLYDALEARRQQLGERD
jgi:hypothetical protein